MVLDDHRSGGGTLPSKPRLLRNARRRDGRFQVAVVQSLRGLKVRRPATNLRESDYHFDDDYNAKATASPFMAGQENGKEARYQSQERIRVL